MGRGRATLMSAKVWNDAWKKAATDAAALPYTDQMTCVRCRANGRQTRISLLADAQKNLHRVCRDCVIAAGAYRKEQEAAGMSSEDALLAAWRFIGIDFMTGQPVERDRHE